MNSKRVIFLFYILSFIFCHAVAQDSDMRQIYSEAESEYKLGRIEQAEAPLRKNLNIFQDVLRQRALRLLALCCMGNDRYETKPGSMPNSSSSSTTITTPRTTRPVFRT
jgi:iron complex outermembrane receptor protein